MACSSCTQRAAERKRAREAAARNGNSSAGSGPVEWRVLSNGVEVYRGTEAGAKALATSYPNPKVEPVTTAVKQ